MLKKNIKLLIIGLIFFPMANVLAMEKVSCGNISGIPSKVPQLVSEIITMIQVIVPVLLIILGSIDLVKGISSQKSDEIKKGQQILVKRMITAAIIFFIVICVKFLVSVVANSTTSANAIECIECFINNNCN